MSNMKASPRRQSDVEAGNTVGGGEYEDGEGSYDPFDISRTKHASIERLRRWRVCNFHLITLIVCYLFIYFFFCFVFHFSVFF